MKSASLFKKSLEMAATAIILSCILLVNPSCAEGQRNTDTPSEPTPHSPYDGRGLTTEPGSTEPVAYEVPSMEDLAYSHRSTPAITPPERPRMIADWEPMQGALIRYPLGIPMEAVQRIALELPVYVLCSFRLQESAMEAFKAAGVEMANIRFVHCLTDTYWVGNYGPLWIETGEPGNRRVEPVDISCRINQERPNDERIPLVMAGFMGLSGIHSANLVCQGGNLFTDGNHTGASTDRVLEDNPERSLSKLQQQAKILLGLEPYHVVTDPSYPGEYIKHFGCWARFIPGNKLLIKRVPKGSANHKKYENVAKEWGGRLNALGQKFEVLRVDGPEESSYCNHVVLNKRVFVPIQDTATDMAALAQIKAAYGAGYEVIGLKAASNAPWLGTDSLRNRVAGIPTGISPGKPTLTGRK